MTNPADLKKEFDRLVQLHDSAGNQLGLWLEVAQGWKNLIQQAEDHIRLLKALLQEPDPDIERTHSIGSIRQTLQRRLPDMESDTLIDLARQLTDMGLADLAGSNTMMTARGAEDLRLRITDYGRKFAQYILTYS